MRLEVIPEVMKQNIRHIHVQATKVYEGMVKNEMIFSSFIFF